MDFGIQIVAEFQTLTLWRLLATVRRVRAELPSHYIGVLCGAWSNVWYKIVFTQFELSMCHSDYDVHAL